MYNKIAKSHNYCENKYIIMEDSCIRRPAVHNNLKSVPPYIVQFKVVYLLNIFAIGHRHNYSKSVNHSTLVNVNDYAGPKVIATTATHTINTM